MNRTNPRSQYGIWPGMRNNSAECFIGNADGVFRAREIRRLEPSGQMGHRSHQQCDWSTVEGDRCAVDSGQTRSRESPIEPDPNPKRRLIMKSASTTVSGSRQEGERRAISDDDSRIQIEDKPEVENEVGAEPPGAPSTGTQRRIAVKSEPRAITTQEAVDGYREKAMRIESVEQIELGNIMELPIAGQVLRWARQSNLSG